MDSPNEPQSPQDDAQAASTTSNRDDRDNNTDADNIDDDANLTDATKIGPGDSPDTATSATAAQPDPPRERTQEEAIALGSRVYRRLNAQQMWCGEMGPLRANAAKKLRAAGVPAHEARARSWEELDRLYPPLAENVPSPPDSPPPVVSKPQELTIQGAKDEKAKSASNGAFDDGGRIQGLGNIPEGWPALPPNAGQQAELAWVQANRLGVCDELPSGAVRVHLSRAHTPAPSHAALGWLETSIRSYAKYVDVVARTLKDEEAEAESVRRERMAIEDIRSLLGEMIEAEAAKAGRGG